MSKKKGNFERNQAIVDCLKLLHSEDPLRAEAQDVLDSIRELEILVPELICEENRLADNHFIAEQYRLLHALGHMLSFNGHREALYCLLPPFKHPFTKRFSEWAIAHQLFYSAEADFREASPEQQTLRWNLILYGLRHELHKEEISWLAYTVLYRLIFQKKEEGFEPIRNLKQDIALLSYSDVLQIASKALSRLDLDESLEFKLLKQLVIERTFNPQIIRLLYQSPEFIAELRRQDSKKLSFVVIEDLLVNPVKEIPKINFEPLTEEQLNSISSCKNSLDESLAPMRVKLVKHIICQQNIFMALRQFYLFTYKEPHELTAKVESQKEAPSCAIF